ncbi:MAG: MG2 domain-containing protein, partial [Desulfobacterales bacterium]
MKLKTVVILILTLFLLAAPAWATDAPHLQIRKKAHKAYADGNWKDALSEYQILCLKMQNDPKTVGNDFVRAWQCLRQLNRINELDAFRESVVQRHAGNWRLLRDAARSYSQNDHWGYMVAGEFHRGHHRGGGKYVNAIARDRVRALQLMQQSMGLAEEDPAKSEVAQFYLQFAGYIQQHRGSGQAWRLQYLTDLTRLPDYEPGYGYHYDQRTQGAPVDDAGRPVYHELPESFETASSDGERWRWLLARAVQHNPAQKSYADHTWASFLHQQFGVQTLASYGAFFSRERPLNREDREKNQSSPYEVNTLSDQETIAKLAVGVRRFNLPPEYNFIQMFKTLLEDAGGYAGNAARTLAQIYENRRQYERAVDYWKIYKNHNRSAAQQHIDQITKNWGVFEPAGVQPAGTAPGVEYRFRNGRRVEFAAYRIRVNRLLEDVKAFIRSQPRKLDWQKINLNNIGWRIVHENQTRYVGKQVASWQMALDPDTRHWDRHVTVKFPDALKAAGSYLVEAKMPQGNTARIIIWVADTVIVKKPLNQQTLYYVADAVSGKALAGIEIDFFGYRTQHIKGTQRYRVIHRGLKRQTDADGLVMVERADMSHQMSWVATVTGGEDRLAFLGFTNVWYANYDEAEYNQTKTLVMTDRPVYRPAQTVRFKAWVRHARYDREDTSSFADRHFTVFIHNPKNEQIYSRTLKADAYGGMEGQFELAADAALGVYRISHSGGAVYGGQTFRVEEYKKPEFEVTVEAPAEPVKLGDKITAKIKAAYYFGSPVTEATVSYKVLRNEHDGRWYPSFYWDWFYGPGYWWYAYDYPWYPGWEEWGCLRPIWSWWQHLPRQQTEIVADGEVK